MKIIHFDEIDSTNSYLKREYSNLENFTVATASHQTNGKGRLGRKWDDDSNSLLFSILLKDNLDKVNSESLSLIVGVAISLVLKDYGFSPKIKWPNDVLLNDKKCLGILLEAIYQKKMEALVIGVGINVNNEVFPDELKNKATSLYLQKNIKFDKDKLLKDFLEKFNYLIVDYKNGSKKYLSILKELSYLDDKDVILDYYGENKHCLVLGIQEDGRLKVKDEDGKEFSVCSGEVTLEKNYEG